MALSLKVQQIVCFNHELRIGVTENQRVLLLWNCMKVLERLSAKRFDTDSCVYLTPIFCARLKPMRYTQNIALCQNYKQLQTVLLSTILSLLTKRMSQSVMQATE